MSQLRYLPVAIERWQRAVALVSCIEQGLNRAVSSPQ